MKPFVLAGTILSVALVSTSAPAGQALRSADELKGFYQAQCARCHGADGSATDSEGRKLKGLDFTDAKEMKSLTDAEAAKAIRKGLFFGLSMPAFGSAISDDEIKVLVSEILRKARKGTPIAPATPPH